MNFDNDIDSLLSDPKQQMIDALTQEMNQVRKRLVEAKAQLDTMQTQVDKEKSRYSGIATDLRTIRENLDTVPREDIRDKYDEALEVRFRLATMQGQLEKIDSTYTELEKKQSLMAQLLSLVQGYEVLPDQASGANPGGGMGLDVVGMIKTQEDERLRLSRAIHDSIAQSLTNFILQTEICQRLFDRNPERAAEELVQLKTNASSTFQKVRDFIFDLRPMMLDDLGVAPTIRRYIDTYKEKNDIDTRLDIQGEERRLENYKEVLIFRSLQDLLTMSRDYASPSEVLVKLDMNGTKIKVAVEDDGRPFDVQKVLQKDNDTTDARVQALRMLKSKLELVGGTINMNSTENDGSTVKIEIPANESV
jgi:two-component system, NarL family, sensor histidine kinase DegS